MKKLLDWLLEAFMWVYGIFLCSLALPLALGLIWLAGEVAMGIREYLNGFGNWQWIIYLFTGLGIKILWLDKRLKDKQNSPPTSDKYNYRK